VACKSNRQRQRPLPQTTAASRLTRLDKLRVTTLGERRIVRNREVASTDGFCKTNPLPYGVAILTAGGQARTAGPLGGEAAVAKASADALRAMANESARQGFFQNMCFCETNPPFFGDFLCIAIIFRYLCRLQSRFAGGFVLENEPTGGVFLRGERQNGTNIHRQTLNFQRSRNG
jgi:hypothetical protein